MQSRAHSDSRHKTRKMQDFASTRPQSSGSVTFPSSGISQPAEEFVARRLCLCVRAERVLKLSRGIPPSASLTFFLSHCDLHLPSDFPLCFLLCQIPNVSFGSEHVWLRGITFPQTLFRSHRPYFHPNTTVFSELCIPSLFNSSRFIIPTD